MTLSDSSAHRSQDGIFQLSISTEKNAFIRFPNPSEAKEVDPKNMCLSDSPEIVNQYEKICLYQIP